MKFIQDRKQGYQRRVYSGPTNSTPNANISPPVSDNGSSYPSDVTDEEWAHIAPLIPPAKHGGRKRTSAVGAEAGGEAVLIAKVSRYLSCTRTLSPTAFAKLTGTAFPS